MNNPCLLILISLAVMACDHRALSLGLDGAPYAQQDGSRSSEEAAVRSTFCESATSITGSQEGNDVELPHAFYGLWVSTPCANAPAWTPKQRLNIKLLFTDDPGECDRLMEARSWAEPARGVVLDSFDIHQIPEQLEGWKTADDATSHLDLDYRVEAGLDLKQVPFEIQDGQLSTPGPEDEVEGCVNLRFRTHSPTDGTGEEIGRAHGAFRASSCEALIIPSGCWT